MHYLEHTYCQVKLILTRRKEYASFRRSKIWKRLICDKKCVVDERIKRVKEHTAADSVLQRLSQLVQDGSQI